MKTKDTKSSAFKRLASIRTNNAIKNIRLLGNLSNKHNYVYGEDDYKRVFTSLEEELKLAKSKFLISLSKRKKFRL